MVNGNRNMNLKTDTDQIANERISDSKNQIIIIPRPVPKHEQTLHVNVTDLFVLNKFAHANKNPVIDRLLPKLLKCMDKLFPRQDIGTKARITSVLPKINFISLKYCLWSQDFVPDYFDFDPNTLNFDIRYLERHDFEDKNFILGKLFLTKASKNT